MSIFNRKDTDRSVGGVGNLSLLASAAMLSGAIVFSSFETVPEASPTPVAVLPQTAGGEPSPQVVTPPQIVAEIVAPDREGELAPAATVTTSMPREAIVERGETQFARRMVEPSVAEMVEPVSVGPVAESEVEVPPTTTVESEVEVSPTTTVETVSPTTTVETVPPTTVSDPVVTAPLPLETCLKVPLGPINEWRDALGLGPIESSEAMFAAACDWALHLAETGQMTFAWPADGARELLQENSTCSAESIADRWLNSWPDMDALTNATTGGIACVGAADGTTVAVAYVSM